MSLLTTSGAIMTHTPAIITSTHTAMATLYQVGSLVDLTQTRGLVSQADTGPSSHTQLRDTRPGWIITPTRVWSTQAATPPRAEQVAMADELMSFVTYFVTFVVTWLMMYFVLIDLMIMAGVSNNAAVITRNRFLMANVGNERATCRNDVFTEKSMRGIWNDFQIFSIIRMFEE